MCEKKTPAETKIRVNHCKIKNTYITIPIWQKGIDTDVCRRDSKSVYKCDRERESERRRILGFGRISKKRCGSYNHGN